MFANPLKDEVTHLFGFSNKILFPREGYCEQYVLLTRSSLFVQFDRTKEKYRPQLSRNFRKSSINGGSVPLFVNSANKNIATFVTFTMWHDRQNSTSTVKSAFQSRRSS